MVALNSAYGICIIYLSTVNMNAAHPVSNLRNVDRFQSEKITAAFILLFLEVIKLSA
jgi:hypothetical protein